MNANLLVIAKAPAPGTAKTRLCPPCTPGQAAELAQAALEDTLHAVAATSCPRRVLVLDGEPGPWLPRGIAVRPQSRGGLGARLAAAFAAERGPALLIGMDTPQVTPELLERCLADLLEPGADAVLGPACDGGYWAIGFRVPDPTAFDGVPMSAPSTLARQRDRLARLGVACRDLPELRDVDDIDDARAIAAAAPATRFAATLSATEHELHAA